MLFLEQYDGEVRNTLDLFFFFIEKTQFNFYLGHKSFNTKSFVWRFLPKSALPYQSQ